MSDVTVRHLILNEALPDGLRTGYEKGACDPSWIWLAESNGAAVGILVTAPAHVLVILMRMVILDGAPTITAYKLLAQGFREMKERGYKGYVMWVNPTQEREQRILRLVAAAGGGQSDVPQILCYGKIEELT